MLTVRRAGTADLETLAPLKQLVHASHVLARPDFFKPMTLDDARTWLNGRLEEQATSIWLAEDSGVSAGYVLTVQKQRAESQFVLARRWCEIDEIVVSSTFRRRGVARALVQQTATQARELGVEVVELATWAFNRDAQRAFARLGFLPMVERWELSSRS